jgi:hypothetical protein
MPAGQVAAQRTLPEQLAEYVFLHRIVLKPFHYVQRYPAPD